MKPARDLSLDSLLERLTPTPGGWVATYRTTTLRSVFQPVLSITHKRVVGYEALLRVVDSNGAMISPAALFDRTRADADALLLDRLARCLHTANFVAQGIGDGWLFLNVTPRVLDLLDRYDARATFFCIGDLARRHPRWIEAIVARGHAIENHSQRHRHTFSLSGPAALRREIAAAQQTLTEIAGTRPLFFRAPAGLRNPFLEPVLCELGLQLASWTRRGFDTRARDAATVTRRLLHGLAARDILLVHDGHAARDARGEPVVLDVLQAVLRAAADAQLHWTTLRAALAPELPGGPGEPAGSAPPFDKI